MSQGVLRLLATGGLNVDGSAPREIVLVKPRTLLGRSKECDFQLTSNIETQPNTISRKHVLIERLADGSFTFEDLGALNGTFLNDRKILKSALLHGDTLQLGGGAGVMEGEKLQSREAGLCYQFSILKAEAPTGSGDAKRRSSEAHPVLAGGAVKKPRGAEPEAERADLRAAAGKEAAIVSAKHGTKHEPSAEKTCAAAGRAAVAARPVEPSTTSHSHGVGLGSLGGQTPGRNQSPGQRRVVLVNSREKSHGAGSQGPNSQGSEALKGSVPAVPVLPVLPAPVPAGPDHGQTVGHGQTVAAAPKLRRSASVQTVPWARADGAAQTDLSGAVEAEATIATTVEAAVTAAVAAASEAVRGAARAEAWAEAKQEALQAAKAAQAAKPLLTTVPTDVAWSLLRELSCGLCSRVLLEARLLPCTHGFCRLCYVERFDRSIGGAVVGGGPGLRSRKCPTCKLEVPEGYRPLGSLHLENMVDLVVESLPAPELDAFRERQRDAREKLRGSVVLGDEEAMEVSAQPSLPGAAAGNGNGNGGGSLAAPGAESDSEGEARASRAKGRRGEESDSEDEGPRCEGCRERGHDIDDCPHKESSDDDDDEEEEDSEDY